MLFLNLHPFTCFVLFRCNMQQSCVCKLWKHLWAYIARRCTNQFTNRQRRWDARGRWECPNINEDCRVDLRPKAHTTYPLSSSYSTWHSSTDKSFNDVDLDNWLPFHNSTWLNGVLPSLAYRYNLSSPHIAVRVNWTCIPSKCFLLLHDSVN